MRWLIFVLPLARVISYSGDQSAESVGEMFMKSANNPNLNPNPNPNMKRTVLFFILLFTFAWSAPGQGNTQSLSFDDLGLGGGTATSGTYNPNDTFSFDVLLTFDGYNALGLSLWLETNTAFAGSLAITGLTYGTAFPNPNPPAVPIFFNGGSSGGYTGENVDLGTSSAGSLPPGTYFVAHITFSITGAAPGTYDLRSGITNPRISEVSGFDGTNFSDNNLPASHYSVTIGVPEPATVGLLGLGATGLAALLLSLRKRAVRTNSRLL